MGILCRRRWELVVIVCLAASGRAWASDALREGLGGLARDVKKLLDHRGESALAVGQFTGPATFPSSAGPGIAQLLTEELQKLGVAIQARAALGIKGEYQARPVGAEKSKSLAVVVRARIEDQLGNVVTDVQLERVLPAEEAVIALMGTAVSLDPRDSPWERQKKILASYLQPQAAFAGTKVKAGPGSGLSMEVLVGGQPRRPSDENGLAFVRIDRGERYAVRLVNDTPQEVAARLTIDGLSIYTFSELRVQTGPQRGEPLLNYVIVPAHGSALVEGWHRTNERSDSFLVTEYAQSAAGLLNSRAGVGTITATYFESHPRPVPMPPAAPKAGARNLPDANATGFGPSVESNFIQVDRVIGSVLGAVSVRYTR